MFIRNTAVLAGGNILAQLISVALIPVITRIYSTEQFGEFSIIAAIAMMLIPISSLRYNAAILLPDKIEDSKALLYLSIFVNFNVIAVLLLIVWIFNIEIARLLGIGDASLLYFIPAIVLLGGYQIIAEAWALRKKAFITISIAGIGATSGDRLIGIVSGVLSVGTIGLLMGRASGLMINVLFTIIGLFKQKEEKNLILVSISDGFRLAKEYRSFALYSWAAMTQQMARQAPIFMLGMFYSSVTAGLYALCFRVLAEPVQILGAALGRSFAQRAAEDKRNNKDISGITSKLFKYLLMIIVVPMVILAIIAPDVFGLIFGDKWKESGHYVQFVAPVFMLTFMLRSLGSLFDVLRKQRDQFVFGLVMLSASVGSFLLGAFGYNIETVLLVFSVSMTLVIGSRILWFLRMVGVDFFHILQVLGETLINALIFGFIVYYLSQILSGNDVALLLISALVVVVYFMQYIYRDAYLKELVAKLIVSIRKKHNI